MDCGSEAATFSGGESRRGGILEALGYATVSRYFRPGGGKPKLRYIMVLQLQVGPQVYCNYPVDKRGISLILLQLATISGTARTADQTNGADCKDGQNGGVRMSSNVSSQASHLSFSFNWVENPVGYLCVTSPGVLLSLKSRRSNGSSFVDAKWPAVLHKQHQSRRCP